MESTGGDINSKEQECIRITSKLLVEKQIDNITPLSNQIIGYFSKGVDETRNIGLILLSWLGYFLIKLPFVILVSPYDIPRLIRQNKEDHKKLEEIKSLHLTYLPPEVHHIQYLWDEYGLKDSLDDKLLSDVASEWISILYPSQFHIEPSEIIALFHEAETEQARVFNAYRSKGLHVSLSHWRHQALDDLFETLPRYG